MDLSVLFLAIRMIIYSLAVPAAAYFGGSFDPETGTITLNLDTLLSMAQGVLVNVGTFGLSRWAKAKGGAT